MSKYQSHWVSELMQAHFGERSAKVADAARCTVCGGDHSELDYREECGCCADCEHDNNIGEAGE